MIQHHIQKTIIHKLAFSEGLRFSQLKPDTLDNKLFNYHLKLVISAGWVKKADDGLYTLTAEGRRMGVGIYRDQLSRTQMARSVLFLVVRRKDDGSWLLYRRSTHPMLGRVGFMHATPDPSQTVEQTATKTTLQKTGLKCEFEVRGSGYFHIYSGDNNLESYTNFTLLVCKDAKGTLKANDDRAEYEWVKDPDFKQEDMLPNMKSLVTAYNTGEIFFLEETLQI